MLLVSFYSLACAKVSQGEAVWHEDFDQVRATAKEENKFILMDFTGSDWCPYCIALEKEVFTQEAFLKFAEEKLVLMKLDFDPYGNSRSKEYGQQHSMLRQSLGVHAYPTIVLLAPDGDYIDTTSYRPGGAEKYVAHLRKFLSVEQ